MAGTPERLARRPASRCRCTPDTAPQPTGDTARAAARTVSGALGRNWPVLRSPWKSFESPGLEMIAAAAGTRWTITWVWDAERAKPSFAADPLPQREGEGFSHPVHSREHPPADSGPSGGFSTLKPKRVCRRANRGLLKDGGPPVLTAKGQLDRRTCAVRSTRLLARRDGMTAPSARQVLGRETIVHLHHAPWRLVANQLSWRSVTPDGAVSHKPLTSPSQLNRSALPELPFELGH